MNHSQSSWFYKQFWIAMKLYYNFRPRFFSAPSKMFRETQTSRPNHQDSLLHGIMSQKERLLLFYAATNPIWNIWGDLGPLTRTQVWHQWVKMSLRSRYPPDTWHDTIYFISKLLIFNLIPSNKSLSYISNWKYPYCSVYFLNHISTVFFLSIVAFLIQIGPSCVTYSHTMFKMSMISQTRTIIFFITNVWNDLITSN